MIRELIRKRKEKRKTELMNEISKRIVWRYSAENGSCLNCGYPVRQENGFPNFECLGNDELGFVICPICFQMVGYCFLTEQGAKEHKRVVDEWRTYREKS